MARLIKTTTIKNNERRIKTNGHVKNLAALLLFSTAALVLGGCSTPQDDPMQQTIPTDVEHWQKKLDGTLAKLPKEDRKLLSRYMIRMKLSEAYESGAMPRTTIEQALVQQREYERLHPDNPTGKKSPVGAAKAATNLYPIVLLPAKTSTEDRLNQVHLQFVLSNHDNTPIKSFKAALVLRDPKLQSGKPVLIPRTQFVPPIMPNDSAVIDTDVSIEDINVMRAIQNPQNVTVHIDKGTIILTDGRAVEIGGQTK